MKKYLILMLTIVVVSCADEDLKPIVTFDDAGHGAYVKLISESGSTDIDFFTQTGNTESYTQSVEFIDDEKGALVAVYSIDLVYRSAAGGSQTITDFRSFPAASFTSSDAGNKSVVNITVTHQELINAFGGVSQADQFTIEGILTMQSGNIHTGNNSSAAVNGTAFQGHFSKTFSVICPSDLAGTHTYTTVGWCGDALNGIGTTTWVAESGVGVYSVVDGAYDFGAYAACYGSGIPGSYPLGGLPLGNLRINDLCNGLYWSGASQWGEVYEFISVSTSGPILSIEWLNDYGEGGVSQITREGGADWPPLFKN